MQLIAIVPVGACVASVKQCPHKGSLSAVKKLNRL